MRHKSPQNYLKTFRRKTGLTQSEVGRLLGFNDGGQVSRHERSQSSPTLQNAFAYAAIYGVTVTEVFAGLSGEMADAMEKKVAGLERALLNTDGIGRQKSLRAQKLAWIAKRKNR